MKSFEAKNFDHLLGTAGFSDNLLKNHFTLYQGYVKNVNLLIEELETLLKDGKMGMPSYAELTRRFAWEFNGMRLHELYFGNMKKEGAALSQAGGLFENMRKLYGSYENWEKDFKTIGFMRGIGWAILYYDPISKKLFNVWVNEHDAGHLSGAAPLLVLDVFEHAYTLDYGIKKADYVQSFFNAIDWSVVEARFGEKL
ncbi:superoxide dismutase [Candidatus Giovannonibacteria bacterium RIFCSPHIGHO2_02_42_15]|uniref:superoxide dismutase n=2 Tax=Candidatus Giovannoniibacteriota TaxID=1752738 RepID=A0A1F5VNT0_9BACT|nr:MAG: Superoxide dismutase [Candidatus Giovannonibacteria bacterium GW2011_GWF2_42_19]OGF64948.1 MAG: superoxide dismutase [Candidatus Giovannonibacteria bacterium RIFCSPHIGHO2_02_42_15]HBB49873.1 superoxide dismutase [Candidatus Nomurabacteria bacterium]HCW87973.1 superoxide dismutase [Candidatus Nomurabacteria bacterium]